MRVIHPVTEVAVGEHAAHPRARRALDRLYPDYELHVLNVGDMSAYWNLFNEVWGSDFILIEHDIEIHENVIKEFEECPQPWCINAYQGAGGLGPGAVLEHSLGAVRFRSGELPQDANQRIWDLPDSIGRADWRRQDVNLLHVLRDIYGLGEPHRHYPDVLHHHRYVWGCACGGYCENE